MERSGGNPIVLSFQTSLYPPYAVRPYLIVISSTSKIRVEPAEIGLCPKPSRKVEPGIRAFPSVGPKNSRRCRPSNIYQDQLLTDNRNDIALTHLS